MKIQALSNYCTNCLK